MDAAKSSESSRGSDFNETTKCRLCGSDDMSQVLDLTNQPPANNLRRIGGLKQTEFPLILCFCEACKTAQLSATLSPETLFAEYVWVTGTSKTAKEYSERFCALILERTQLYKSEVIEIASNDGTFLSAFEKRGCSILGVDPAKNIADLANESGIPTIAKFFNSEVADEILLETKRKDITIARNVIPHVKDILSIIEGLRKLTKDDGTVVVEFHHAQSIVDELQYDSIYHEHLFYFSLSGISKLFRKFDLYAFDVFNSPISGGSIVALFSPREKDPSEALKSALLGEASFALDKLDTWNDFGVRALSHSKNLLELIKRYSKRQKIIAYGASARSSTMLNFAKINCDLIEFVIDKNPLKEGKLTPGTNIPIVNLAQGLDRANDRPLLLLAWNFQSEIISELRSQGFKGQIIVPLPNEINVL